VVTATLTETQDGAHLRLRAYGLVFASYPVALQRAETPTDAATATLDEYGWTLAGTWQQPAGTAWSVNVVKRDIGE
jgi:hypothetical protein